MKKTKIRRALDVIRNFLTPLQSKDASNDYGLRLGPPLEPYSTARAQMAHDNPPHISRHSPYQFTPSDTEVERINNERLEQAKLNQAYEQMAQDREALNLNLKSQHRLLIATLITALVALASSIMAVPTVSRRMDGAKALSATTALHKAFTVLAYGADSIKHANKIKNGSWSEVDMMFRQTTAPMFCPWDGGIMVMDDAGQLLCALAAAGRSSEGDRRLMVLAAHKMGYKTNFDEHGDPLPA